MSTGKRRSPPSRKTAASSSPRTMHSTTWAAPTISKSAGFKASAPNPRLGLKDINDLVNFLVDHKIPAVFVESSVSQKNVRALIEGAKYKGHDVKIGGELFSDAMGETGTYEGTYIGMLDHNITTIVRALGGEAPAKGLNGKLSE